MCNRTVGIGGKGAVIVMMNEGLFVFCLLCEISWTIFGGFEAWDRVRPAALAAGCQTGKLQADEAMEKEIQELNLSR